MVDTITVTAMATPGKTVTVMIESIIVSPANMDEDEDSPGAYTRSHPLAAWAPDRWYVRNHRQYRRRKMSRRVV